MDAITDPAAGSAPSSRPPVACRWRWFFGRCQRAVAAVASLLVAGSAALAVPASAQSPGPCREGRLPGGALSLICVPAAGWNGELVLFAHGYVAPGERLRFPQLVLPGRAGSLPEVVQRAGYAFATTSYRRNGLAVLEGIEDLRELRVAFATTVGPPTKVLATGVSEGGLVVTLLAERHPDEINGALATCAPLGGLRRQVDYIGDVRVLFDVFFPRVLPGHPTRVPARVRRQWERVYRPRIVTAVRKRREAARRLVRTAGAAVDPRDPRSLAETVVSALWYSVHAGGDLARRLGGNPYDNTGRRYSGSGDDRRLNRRVRRLRSSPRALANLAAYEPTGALRVPVITMHTTLDEVVPAAHQAVYASRVAQAGAGDLLTTRSIRRYGHCEFRADEILQGFSALAARVRSAG